MRGTKGDGRLRSVVYILLSKNIAVVGVSPAKNNLGKNIVLNCLYFGYPGEVIPVGLSKGVVFGQRIHENLESVDRDIDLAVILTPAKTIPGSLNSAAAKESNMR